MKQFPPNFLLGGAISACQVEGAYLEGGKGLCSYDLLPRGGKGTKGSDIPFSVQEASPYHTAIDFYHRYKEDVALLSEMGLLRLRAGAPAGDSGACPQGPVFGRVGEREPQKRKVKASRAV